MERFAVISIAFGLCIGLVLGQNVTNSTGTGPEFSYGQVRAKVLGKSGKITFNTTDAKSRVTIEFDGIQEKDSANNDVGTSGNVKHTFNTFANQDFTYSQPMNGTIYNVSATCVTFQSQLSGLSSVFKVKLCIIHQDANVTVGNETIELRQGMLKFNFELYNWTFCNGSDCTKGQTNQIGEFIDVTVVIKGSGTAKPTSANKPKKGDVYELGTNEQLIMSKQVEIDGVWQQMPDGYPKFISQGSKELFTIRIPKFSSKAMYDPVITLASEGTTTTVKPTTTAPINAANSLQSTFFTLVIVIMAVVFMQ